MKKFNKKKVGIVAILLSIFILGAATFLPRDVDPDIVTIGEKDGPTDIWVTTDLD